MPIGILIDKELQNVNQVFLPIFSPEDSFLLDYIQKLIYNNNSKITILDVNNLINTDFVMQSAINSLEQKYPDNISFIQDKIVTEEFLSNEDLMVISLESWKAIVDSRTVWLRGVPSSINH